MEAAATVVPLHQLVADVRRSQPRLGGIRLVCIDGPSGAGKKTLLADRLSNACDEAMRPLSTVHLDDVYEGWDGLSAVADQLDSWLLAPLRAGHPGGFYRYDWHAGRYADWQPVPAETATLVLEGVGALAAGSQQAVLGLWLDAPAELRHRRGLERDGETYRPFWQRWAAAEHEHFARYSSAERADLWIDGAPTLAHDPEREVVVCGGPP